MSIDPSWLEKYSDSNLDRMRTTCDPLADAVAARLVRQRPSAMVDEIVARAEREGGPFAEFVAAMDAVPTWVDWDRIDRARRVGLAFGNVRAVALLVSSLVEGYSLSKAAHVLIATGRLHQDVLRRVYETSQMTHNMNVPDGLRPGNPGHRTIAEVRVLHAMVRRHLRERRWDVSVYDEPINQEDMAFTIIEFDHLANRGMRRMGARLSDRDLDALHHLWRYVAHLNGVCEGMLTDSVDEEIYQYARIRTRQYSPNDEGRALAHAVITSLAGQPPFELREEYLFELSRLCLGDELADAYRLPRHRGFRTATGLYIAANRFGTKLHYGVPGFDRLSETVNFRVLRNALRENLDSDPEKRAFRAIA